MKNVLHLTGKNSYKLVPGTNSGTHAEYAAYIKTMRKYGRKVRRMQFDLYVEKFTNQGNYGICSKPCDKCLNRIKNLRIRYVYYLDNGVLIRQKFDTLLNEKNKHISNPSKRIRK